MKYKIKYRILRFRVKWRMLARSVNRKIMADTAQLSTYEEKAIKLWRILLRDENTQMSNNTDGVRQIEKGNVFMILQSIGNMQYMITLMNIEDISRSLYELRIPEKYANIVAEYFDVEMNKRMKKVESNKRKIIETDIDRLIEKEERLVVGRITNN